MERNSFHPSFEMCSLHTYVVRSPSSPYLMTSIAVCILNAIFGIVGTFLNTLVLFVFLKSKKIRRKISYFLIMVLSLNDLVVVIIFPTLFLVNSVSEILGTPQCLYKICYKIVAYTIPPLSAMALTVMNVERYLGIVRPIFHHSAVTKRKITFAIIFLYCISLFISAIHLVWNDVGYAVISVVAFAICGATLFVYLSIFFVARKLLCQKKIAINNIEETISHRSLLRQLKMARMCLSVVFLCFLCYLPIAVISGISQYFWAHKDTTDVFMHCYLWVSLLITMNATLNCILFFWGNRELRKQGWKFVRNCFRRTLH